MWVYLFLRSLVLRMSIFTVALHLCSFAVKLCVNVNFSLVLPFVSGGDKDEGEDTVGDLRRTESDSVLKKVSVPTANYSRMLSCYTPVLQ